MRAVRYRFAQRLVQNQIRSSKGTMAAAVNEAQESFYTTWWYLEASYDLPTIVPSNSCEWIKTEQ